MWFLIALFTVSLVHYLLARSGKLWWYKWIVPLCFVCYFFFTAGVYFFQPETSVQMRYMRNAWFFGLPCFGLGYLLAGIKWPRSRLAQIIYGVLGVVFFGLQMVEDSLWRTPNCKIEMYVSGVLAAVCLLQFFLCIRRADADPKKPRKVIIPQASDVIESDDKLIVFGETKQLDKLS